MADIPILIVFGPSEDSFYVGAGRRFFIQNMPQSLTEKVGGTELPIGSVAWISVDSTGKYWCGENVLSQTIHYSVKADSDLLQHLESSQPCEFVTFPEDAASYFVKHKSRGTWNADLEEPYISTVTQLQENIKNFDLGLKWIIFGHAGSHIYQLETGFLFSMEGRHEDPEHPLRKALKKFDDDTEHTWIIDKGSSLCLYDDRYFMLRVKESGSSTSELIYNLPPAMDEKLKELVELARTPEEQQALLANQQNMIALVNARTAQATARMNMQLNMQLQMSSMLQTQCLMNRNTIGQAGMSVANAASDNMQWNWVNK